MRVLAWISVAFAAACSTGSGSGMSDDPVMSQDYQVTENCTVTTACPDGGTNTTFYSFTGTDPWSDSNSFPDLGASFTNPNNPGAPNPDSPGGSTGTGTSTGTSGGAPGSTSGGSNTCMQQTSCTPSCQNMGNNDVCGGSLPPGQGGCWVTGGGYIVDADGHDSFGGNAMPMKSGSVRGEWEENDHGTGNKSHGKVQYIVCRNVPNEPGPGQPSGPSHHFDINQAYFGGPARWFSNNGWQDGFWFDVMVEDHGEPGNTHAASNGHGSGVPDFYHFTIRQMMGNNQSGPIVYDTSGDLVGGNIQIHPPNNGHPYNGGTLPPWVSYQP
jgi:hypothetical protein